MPSVVDAHGDATPRPDPAETQARSVEAQKLLDMFAAAQPKNPDAFIPGVGMPGGADVPKPHGLYTYALIGPDVWPSESESKLKEAADQLAKLARNHENASDSANSQVDEVFGQYWTAGNGAAAAEEQYLGTPSTRATRRRMPVHRRSIWAPQRPRRQYQAQNA
jgi:hypothetical protein